MITLAVLLTFASLMMLGYRPRPWPVQGSNAAALALGLPVGAVAGFVRCLLGVGGGNIIVPTLVASGLEPRRAAASASFVVLFASLSGFLAHATVAEIETPLLVSTGLASAVGAALGAWLASEKLRAEQRKRIITIVLMAVAIKTAWSLL